MPLNAVAKHQMLDALDETAVTPTVLITHIGVRVGLATRTLSACSPMRLHAERLGAHPGSRPPHADEKGHR